MGTEGAGPMAAVVETDMATTEEAAGIEACQPAVQAGDRAVASAAATAADWVEAARGAVTVEEKVEEEKAAATAAATAAAVTAAAV